MLKVFGKECAINSKTYFTIDGPEYANKAKMQIPVCVVRGAEAGPTFWINGCVHGDELNGSYAAWELSRELETKKLRGNIIITPVANVAAFVDRTKTSSIDELDMDTQFPGDAAGMVTQIVAKILYDEIKEHASFLVNFHTLSSLYDAEPYTVSKKVPGADPKVNQESLDMALIFGVKTNCVVDLATATGELPGVMHGALDITCMRDGIPAFMAEMGHGGVIDHEIVGVSKRGLRNLMIHRGMLQGEVERDPKQYRLTKRKFVRTPIGGMIEMNNKPGDIVKAGDTIANLHYFGEELWPHKVEQDAYLIATRVYPAINTGDRVAFLGLEWEEAEQ